MKRLLEDEVPSNKSQLKGDFVWGSYCWFSSGSRRVLGGSRRVFGKFLAESRQDLGKISRLLAMGSFIGVLEGFGSRFLA